MSFRPAGNVFRSYALNKRLLAMQPADDTKNNINNSTDTETETETETGAAAAGPDT